MPSMAQRGGAGPNTALQFGQGLCPWTRGGHRSRPPTVPWPAWHRPLWTLKGSSENLRVAPWPPRNIDGSLHLLELSMIFAFWAYLYPNSSSYFVSLEYSSAREDWTTRWLFGEAK